MTALTPGRVALLAPPPASTTVTGTAVGSFGGALSATATATVIVPATAVGSFGGALSATVSASITATVSGTVAGSFGGALTATVSATVTATRNGVIAASFGGALTATVVGEADGVHYPTNAVTGLGWRGLLNEARRAGAELSATAPLLACPHDGEPLDVARGVRHCGFCGEVYPL